MNTFQRAAKAFNAFAVLPMLRIPGLSKLTAGSMTVLTYTGRRSGTPVVLPVAYKRVSDHQLLVQVAVPGQKTWWRNFTGDGAELNVRLPEGERQGRAVATQDDRGRVSVDIVLS